MMQEVVKSNAVILPHPDAEELNRFVAWTFRSWSDRCCDRGHS